MSSDSIIGGFVYLALKIKLKLINNDQSNVDHQRLREDGSEGMTF